MPEAPAQPSVVRRAIRRVAARRERWVLLLLGTLGWAVSLLLPPHTAEAKANQLLMFYAFGGVAVTDLLLSRRLTAGSTGALSVAAMLLCSPRFFGFPATVDPDLQTRFPAPSPAVRALQLAVLAGLGMASLLVARLVLGLLRRLERWRWHWPFAAAPSLAYLATVVALISCIGQGPLVATIVFWALAACSALWMAVPWAFVQWDMRPRFLAFISVGLTPVAGLMFWEFFYPGLGITPYSSAGIAYLLVLVTAVAFGLTGWAVILSVVVTHVADALGGLLGRFAALSVIIFLLFYVDLFQQLAPKGERFWLIQINGDGEFRFHLDLPLAVMAVVALVRRLSRELAKARRQFRQIARGSLPSMDAPGDAETGQLLRGIARLSDRLQHRDFLEELTPDLRARTQQLGEAMVELQSTAAERVKAEGLAAVAGVVAELSHDLRQPVEEMTSLLPLLRTYVASTAEAVRGLRRGQLWHAGLLSRLAAHLRLACEQLELQARYAVAVLSGTEHHALQAIDVASMPIASTDPDRPLPR